MSEGQMPDQAFVRLEEIARRRGLPEIERSTSCGMPALKVNDASFVRLKDSQAMVLLCPAEHATNRINSKTRKPPRRAAVLVSSR